MSCPKPIMSMVYEKIRGIWDVIINCCKSFCLQTSIHGFKHIAAPRRHWIERILWISITALAIWGVVDTSLGQWQRYRENPTVVTLEKDFRTWLIQMPGVTACEQNKVSAEKLPKAVKKRWNVEPDDEKFAYYSQFVNVVANSDLFHLNGYEAFLDDPELNVNLYQLAVEVMPDHRVKLGPTELLLTKWTPVMSEVGVCNTINSLAIADVAIGKQTSNDSNGSLTSCKYSSQGCSYMFECTTRIDYYIHSPYDIADTLIPPFTIYPSLNSMHELSTTETRAGPGVRDLPPHTRHCLYNDEPLEPSRKVYSSNICRQGCRSRLALKLCGCKPFYYFYTDGPLCTPAGMWCLAAFSHRLATFDGVKCPCSQQCLDFVFREVSKKDQIWDRGPSQSHGVLRLNVQAPRTRYTRYIVFHLQDLIVSFGGAAGLFLGASFISFVEIGYFILERILRVGNDPQTSNKHTVIKTIAPYEARIQELTFIINSYKYRQRDI